MGSCTIISNLQGGNLNTIYRHIFNWVGVPVNQTRTVAIYPKPVLDELVTPTLSF